MSGWTDCIGRTYRYFGDLWRCTAHEPRSGLWMHAVDRDEKPKNISERAIGRTFHEVMEPDDVVQPRHNALIAKGCCARCGDVREADPCATCAAYGLT